MGEMLCVDMNCEWIRVDVIAYEWKVLAEKELWVEEGRGEEGEEGEDEEQEGEL